MQEVRTMPCDKLAVVSATVNTDVSALFTSTDKMAAAIRAVAAKTLGVTAPNVGFIWSGEGFVLTTPGGVRYTVTKVGITASGGSRYTLNAAIAELAVALKGLAGLVVQAKVREALKLRYRVEQEQRTSAGALVMTLDI
jgi:hypothetical protein